MKYVLDADVLIGALDGSDLHHSQARGLFTAWRNEGATTSISLINLSEVLVAPAVDNRRLRAAREAIAGLGLAIHVPTEVIGVDAARLRGRHPISLPDAYLLATARRTNSSAVSFDLNVTRAARTEGIAIAAND